MRTRTAGPRAPRGRTYRARRLPAGLALAPVALLLLTSPLVTASVVATGDHERVQTSRTVATAGCHRLTDSTPRFHRASGIATWQAKALASTCPKVFPGPSQSNSASAEIVIAVAIPVKAPAGQTGPSTVQFDWNVSALGNISTSLASSCPKVVVNASNGVGYQFCEVAAYAGVSIDAYLYDETNGSSIYPTVTPGGFEVFRDTTNLTSCFDYYCYGSNTTSASPNSTFSTPFADRIDLVATLARHHQYVVITTLTALVETVVSGYPGHGRATADLALSSGGGSTLLGGVTVS